MSKKPSLAAALQEASGKKSMIVRDENHGQSSVPDTSFSGLPPSRQGKKAITGFFDPAVSRQLKQLALDEDRTVQALLTEALNDLFIKHRRNPIA
jgi:hypothetical protein